MKQLFSMRIFFLCWMSVCERIISAKNSSWLLYRDDAKKADCILYDNRYYCHVVTSEISPTISSSLCKGNRRWTFSALKTRSVTTNELLRWLIPFNIIESYAEYTSSESINNSEDAFICNCSIEYIGPMCNYKLMVHSFGVANEINMQLTNTLSRNDEVGISLVDGMNCSSNVLMFEWRHVCDGIIQCWDAIDERDCYLLEHHRCEPDEFQCRNGMCIPKEFVFDTEFDCMDSSDEQELTNLYDTYNRCPRLSAAKCDERVCRKDQFSCGDGQCVHWSALIHHSNGCNNLRDAAYVCETVDAFFTDNKFTQYTCQQTREPLPILTPQSSCSISMRHLLVGTGNKIALTNIMHRCPEHIPYPEHPVLSPVLHMFYNKSRILEFYQNGSTIIKQIPRRPHIICLQGVLVCYDIQMTLPKAYCFSYEQFERWKSYPFFPVSHLFCQLAANSSNENTTKRYVWNDNDHQPLASSFQCSYSRSSLATRRINDGYVDCPNGEDEKNSSHAMTEPYRYRCQTVLPIQYVSYQQLGNGIGECEDGTDELSSVLSWTSLKCFVTGHYACWVFQGDGIQENRISGIRLPFHLYCNTFWDTKDGHDERNCSYWICPQNMYQCKATGQCIQKTDICDGEFDCENGEDEFGCSILPSQWSLERRCNSSHEYFCITTQFLENKILDRPCIPYSKIGDSQVDCIGGRDERNTFSCSDHLMLGNRFLCDNQTKCISHTGVCNGIDDCVDRTDEVICFWSRHDCTQGQFTCASTNDCLPSRCNSKYNCSDASNWFWCPKQVAKDVSYRAEKNRRLLNYAAQCYGNLTIPLIIENTVTVSNELKSKAMKSARPYGYCNRGFFLTTVNSEEYYCFCPPSFYGDRCQYNRRRVTVLVRFDRHHRSDIPPVILVLITLVVNNSEILDHKIITDVDRQFPEKHLVYLLYPIPKPKGIYSIRVEAYHSTTLLAVWNYPISPLDFLPVLRISKVLRFPDGLLRWISSSDQCKNNGTSYKTNNGENFCLCQRGWYGPLCERRLENITCSLNSLVRDRNICICSHGYIEPRCFVRNLKCEEIGICLPHQNCHPLSTLPSNQHECICNSSYCDSEQAFMIIHRNISNDYPILIQSLKISADFTHVRQQILIYASSEFPIVRAITMNHLRFKNNGTPEIGLLFQFYPERRSVSVDRYLLFVNCSQSITNYSINLDLMLPRCRMLNYIESQSTTRFHSYCHQASSSSCFMSENYICHCNPKITNRAECFSYHQRNIECTYCLNQGFCIQGDLQNKSDFVCVCPKCTFGNLCQYTTNRFIISLEFLIEKTNWNRLHFIAPGIFVFFGLIFNGLSILTLRKRQAHQSGVGFYLLMNAMTSLSVLITFLSRIYYLYMLRRTGRNSVINGVLCKILPFLMSYFNYSSLWLMTFVTIERALGAALPSRFVALRRLKSAVIITVLMFGLLFTLNYTHSDSYKLVSHPENVYSWCIQEIDSGQEKSIQYASVTHRVCPVLVNLVGGLIIIVSIGRSKALSKHCTKRSAVAGQLRERFDLLLGPTVCFITQLPQLIILFLDACDYYQSSWFADMTLLVYYVSFVPQISVFFLYILPSRLFKKVLLTQTAIGKWIKHI